jgi:hypothetical protein
VRRAPHAAISLPPVAQSIRDARAFVVTMLEVWHCDDPERTAELLTSEVVTNAVRYASNSVRLDATLLDPSTVRIETTDDNPDVPVRREPDLAAAGGRGIFLVESLARRWGFHSDGVNKVVWFETAVAPRASPGSAVPSSDPADKPPDDTGGGAWHSWVHRLRPRSPRVRLSMNWHRSD